MSWVRTLGQGPLCSQAQALRQKTATEMEKQRRPSFQSYSPEGKALNFQRPSPGGWGGQPGVRGVVLREAGQLSLCSVSRQDAGFGRAHGALCANPGPTLFPVLQKGPGLGAGSAGSGPDPIGLTSQHPDRLQSRTVRTPPVLNAACLQL